MRNYTALGLIFANMHDDVIPEITAIRALGSLPFGGRYRLIDFVLSGMVNAGIINVGVITKRNYQSLMDHLGSGKAWDLSRKREGLFFLPPRSGDDALYQGRLHPLADVRDFLRRCKENYVVISDCHMVGNWDYGEAIRAHIESGATVTMAYCHGDLPDLPEIPHIKMDENHRVVDMLVGKVDEIKADYGLGFYVMDRLWLLRTIDEAMARDWHHFERDILQRRLGDITVKGFEVKNMVMPIYSMDSYYKANLALLDSEVRQQLFPKERPVYTKLRDCAPTQYGLRAEVTDSLVADGARIDGTVKNCVLFRGATVGRDCHLENCVIMQDVMVDNRCHLNCVIADKNAVFREGRTLQGFDSYPVYIAKNSIV